MPEAATERFTVGVFQDAASAAKAIGALKRHGFAIEELSLLGKESAPLSSLVEQEFGTSPQKLELGTLGPGAGRGHLIDALGGAEELAQRGLSGTMTRVGFQAHDGRIYETLVGRGGVLVGVCTEPRAADALATLHAYGGGNAAIGAWTGRV